MELQEDYIKPEILQQWLDYWNSDKKDDESFIDFIGPFLYGLKVNSVEVSQTFWGNNIVVPQIIFLFRFTACLINIKAFFCFYPTNATTM